MLKNLLTRAGFRLRALQALVLCVATVVMLGAGTSQYDRVGHEMVCQCSCGQGLLECNHVGCPVSPVMMGELRARIGEGGTDVQIENWFVAKYGAIVLAAPMRGGFDNVAWIVQISVFVLATIGTAFVVWLWRRRTLRLAGADGGLTAGVDFAASSTLSPQEAAMRERIRSETEYR
jgi:cytochrome c-type biogenesis protein CcmH/NrfF